jgi:uncharacterized membrane protein (DUF2068 family)
MDWSLYRCGRSGHVTYAPDEPRLREQMSASTASGDLWQCLRCGTYVPGPPDDTGPAGQAPSVKRGAQVRGDFILKLFAIERAIRVLLFGTLAFGLWKFRSDRLTLIQVFNKDVPIVRSLFQELGFNVNTSLVHELHRLLHISPTELTLIASGITVLAVVEALEAYALWQARRWGEYFAMIVTALGVPVELYELSNSVTVTKIILLLLNLLLVVYLIWSRRLLGVRGGKHAYENRLRADSVIDEAEKAAAAREDRALSRSADTPQVTQDSGQSAPATATAPPNGGPHSPDTASPATTQAPANDSSS